MAIKLDPSEGATSNLSHKCLSVLRVPTVTRSFIFFNCAATHRLTFFPFIMPMAVTTLLYGLSTRSIPSFWIWYLSNLCKNCCDSARSPLKMVGGIPRSAPVDDMVVGRDVGARGWG